MKLSFRRNPDILVKRFIAAHSDSSSFGYLRYSDLLLENFRSASLWNSAIEWKQLVTSVVSAFVAHPESILVLLLLTSSR